MTKSAVWLGCLVVIVGLVWPRPALAFSLPNFDSSGLTGLICRYVKLFCPTTNTPAPPGGGLTPTLPQGQNNAPKLNQPGGGSTDTPGRGFSLPNFSGLPADVLKKLWGDNPPPSWGGIGGSKPLPIPGGKNGSGATGGGAGGPNPGVIQKCTGGLGDCASACQGNRAACNDRYCYCQGGGSGPDCKTLIDLSTHFPGAANCGGQGNGGSDGSGKQGGQVGGPVVGTPVQGCISGQVEPCIAACKADQVACNRRIADCRAGRASGGDCNTFAEGYDICCTSADKLARCREQDPALTNAFCGTSGGTIPKPQASAPAKKGSVESYCDDNPVDCEALFRECVKAENNCSFGCAFIQNGCRKDDSQAYCLKRGLTPPPQDCGS